MFPELPDPEAFRVALEQVDKTQKQVYTRMVADSAIQGLAAMVSRYRESSKAIVQKVGAVLSQKLVRRLCDNCKLGFEPPPQLLKQLGIPPGRVAMLYQPFIPPPIEQQVDENGRPAPITPCHVCEGRGYYGRIAIFELLIPGDQFKDALAKTQDQSQLAQTAKSEGHRGIQAEAVLTVARGLTSLDELKRVFAKK
jgi:type II secretory ATPase GspE/PulE/Tfp pilus assembly ATPase PilB-like protein